MGNTNTKNNTNEIMNKLTQIYTKGSYITHRANQFIKIFDDMDDDFFLSEEKKEAIYQESYKKECNEFLDNIKEMSILNIPGKIDSKMKEHDEISKYTNDSVCCFTENPYIYTYPIKHPLSTIKIMMMYDIIEAQCQYCKKHGLYASNLVKVTPIDVTIHGCFHKIYYHK